MAKHTGYYPLQIPYILDQDFARCVKYTEKVVESLKDFLICLWTMEPLNFDDQYPNNVIMTDGCIDLVVLFDEQQIGYSGMSTTKFNDIIDIPHRYFGARLKPGAFAQLTGLPANRAMDNWLPISEVDSNFDHDHFFNLSFEDAKEYFINYLLKLVGSKTPNQFVNLFDQLSVAPPTNTAQLYDLLQLSPRQAQRLFAKHFALTPQKVIAVIRFQYCLQMLTAKTVEPKKVLDLTTYYDQAHFIKDFKRHIGLTPFELLAKYENCRIFTIPDADAMVECFGNTKTKETLKMNFKKLTPRILVRKDYGACFDFYVEKMGMVATWGDRNGPYTSFAFAVDQSTCFSMFAGVNVSNHKGYVQPVENSISADTVELCFLVDDVYAECERLKTLGVEFVSEPAMMNWGAVHALIRDPEGNLIDLSNGDA